MEGEVEDEKADIEAEAVYDAKKEGGKVTYSVEASFEANIPGEDVIEGSGVAKIVLNADKKKAEVSISAEYLDEQYDFLSAEFKLIDTKDQFSLTPKTITIMEEEFEVPFDITVSYYRKPDKIKANKYVDVLDMDEDEFEDLLDELEKSFEDLAKDLAEDFGDIDLDDALGGLEGILGDMGPSMEIPSLTPDYDYDYDWDEDYDWEEDYEQDYIYPEISYEF